MDINDLRSKLLTDSDKERLDELISNSTNEIIVDETCAYNGNYYTYTYIDNERRYERFDTRVINVTQEQARSALLVRNPYYASQTNYSDSDYPYVFDTVDEFMDEFGNVDIDLNLVYRFDVTWYDEDEFYDCFPEGVFRQCEDGLHREMQITMIGQRKGIYMPCIIKSITDKDYIPLYKFLQKAYWRLTESWKGFTPYSYIKTLIIKRNELRKQAISAPDYDKKILRMQISQIDSMINRMHGSYVKKR
jgi:hypothetical protein